jgi:hypothetical protein
MWLGIGNIIPITKIITGGAPPPVGDFVELEPNLFLMALESGLSDKVELE